MPTITFPTMQAGDITVDVDEIASLQPAGMFTIVTLKDGHFYNSPAPVEMLEVSLLQGGGIVRLDTRDATPLPPVGAASVPDSIPSRSRVRLSPKQPKRPKS